MFDRRQILQILKSATGMAAGVGSSLIVGSRVSAFAAETTTLPFANGERPLVKFPGKRQMIALTSRPPQLETPFSVFNEGVLTPNDAFFVRYHLADIPLKIDADTFRVEVKGKVDQPLSLSISELKTGFESAEIVAVN